VLVNVSMIVMGIFAMFMTFHATGTRGAFSKGPLLPISTAGRVIMFVGGLLIVALAALRLMRSR
jgi:hypothetical protein